MIGCARAPRWCASGFDTAAEHRHAALHGVRRSIPTLRMVGQEFAAGLALSPAAAILERSSVASPTSVAVRPNHADPRLF